MEDIDACAECGGLLCVFRTDSPNLRQGIIQTVLNPEPAPDVEWVRCGTCGTVLFEA